MDETSLAAAGISQLLLAAGMGVPPILIIAVVRGIAKRQRRYWNALLRLFWSDQRVLAETESRLI
ncbi:MAG TPA: hypothetical protein VIC53_06205 [Wenzhouxiangella sp.]